MTTTKTFTARSQSLAHIQARADGKWDYDSLVLLDKNKNLAINLADYAGLSAKHIISLGTADIANFSSTVLPWRFDFDCYLANKRYCLMNRVSYDYIGVTAKSSYVSKLNGTIYKGGSYEVTIDKSGLASFRRNTCIKISVFSQASLANSWELVIRASAISSNNSNNWLLYNGIVGINNRSADASLNWNMEISCAGFTTYELTAPEKGKFYDLKIEFTGSEYKISHREVGSESWTLDYSEESTTKVDDVAEAQLGGAPSSDNSYWAGQIDLPNSYYREDNNDPVYFAELTYVPFYTENFGKVGSVLVSNDYIASNFYSTSRYITTGDYALRPSNLPWVLTLKYKTSLYVGSHYLLLGTSSFKGGVYIVGNSSGKLALSLSSSGSNYDIGSGTGTTVLQGDTWYWVKVTFDGSKYQLLLSTDGINYTTEVTINSATPIYQNTVPLQVNGVSGSDMSTYLFDMKEFAFTVDGVEVYRMAAAQIENLPGIFYNYVDDGSEGTFNCFVVGNDDHVELTKDSTHPTGYYLGQVTIPAHDVYTYLNGVWTKVEP